MERKARSREYVAFRQKRGTATYLETFAEHLAQVASPQAGLGLCGLSCTVDAGGLAPSLLLGLVLAPVDAWGDGGTEDFGSPPSTDRALGMVDASDRV